MFLNFWYDGGVTFDSGQGQSAQNMVQVIKGGGGCSISNSGGGNGDGENNNFYFFQLMFLMIGGDATTIVGLLEVVYLTYF